MRSPAWPLLLAPVWALVPLLLAWGCLAAGSGGQLGGLGWALDLLGQIAPVHGVVGVQPLQAVAWAALGLAGPAALLALRARPDGVGAQARAALPIAGLLLPAVVLAPVPLAVLSGLPADAAAWAWPEGDPALVARARLGAAAGFLPLLIALPAAPAWREGLQAALQGAPAPGLPPRVGRYLIGAGIAGLVILGMAARELARAAG